ncbi:hypothetical protein NliqN6_5245 [Naganishia liquefaciens]|uniref:Peroxisomal adenine nucleotide transporter 1 n=1 Tax=Naganishia liquefaciens TaxID=104408 RepID=A0A8H3TXE1_9TREE|nr:hypothetical protein NliqN6_5245 [Naganishia liquefaciens]
MAPLSLAEALKTETLTPFGNALAGALGGVASNTLVYPLDTVKTRIQASQDEAPGLSKQQKTTVLNLILRIWRREGLTGFFKGFSANMINTFSMQFAYFFFHSWLRDWTLKRLSRNAPKPVIQLSTSLELILGALAGAFAQIFTIPVAVIATRQQLHVSEDGAAAPGLFETAREIIAEHGLTGLWMGLKPGLVLTVNPAITYGVFERVKGILVATQVAAGAEARLTPGRSFAIGVLSKTLATVVTYPYIFAKVRLQARPTTNVSSSGTQSTSLPASSSANATDPTAPTSFANVVASTEPAHESGTHFVSEKDLEANAQEVTAQTPLKAPASTVNKQARQTSAIGILRDTYKMKGFGGWYQGMQAQILKAVLSQGILFMLKNQFERYALIIMILSRRLLRRA